MKKNTKGVSWSCLYDTFMPPIFIDVGKWDDHKTTTLPSFNAWFMF
jgi:hypothetical protein